MKFLKKLLIVLNGSWSVGIGLRMLSEGLKGSIYKPCLFDILFDWLGLAILGIASIVIVITSRLY